MEKIGKVVVIGGGATGTGILRDLVFRGVECVLVERGDLASGTSGRFHGLLHSGARNAHRISSLVMNRLHVPSDGDIFVPHGSVTVFGTTSKSANCPDDDEVASEEVFSEDETV